MKAQKKSNNRVRANCPDCGSSLTLQRPEVDDEITCIECGSNLIVTRLNPVKLDWAQDDNNDDDFWDDSDEEDWPSDDEE
jgi:lysine biosynthesis protein LysW